MYISLYLKYVQKGETYVGFKELESTYLYNFVYFFKIIFVVFRNTDMYFLMYA